jgi:hypothetical protein
MQPQSLAEFKWQHRLLITQVDSEMELIKLQDKILHHSNDFNARKLLLLVHIKDQTFILNTTTQQMASDSLHKEILITLKQNPNKSLLIGLDGGIKNHYPTKTFTAELAFDDIDLMPMRQAEIDWKTLKLELFTSTGLSWSHELAKKRYEQKQLTDKEYGYLIAYLDLGHDVLSQQ